MIASFRWKQRPNKINPRHSQLATHNLHSKRPSRLREIPRTTRHEYSLSQTAEMPICIECRHPVKTLWTQYSGAGDKASGHNIRLTVCRNCGHFCDKYVEHDFVVLFIDLVLIKPQASLFVLLKAWFGFGLGLTWDVSRSIDTCCTIR